MQITTSKPIVLAQVTMPVEPLLYMCNQFKIHELCAFSNTSKDIYHVTGFCSLWKKLCEKAKLQYSPKDLPRHIFLKALNEQNYQAQFVCSAFFTQNAETNLANAQLDKIITKSRNDLKKVAPILSDKNILNQENCQDLMTQKLVSEGQLAAAQLSKIGICINFPEDNKMDLKDIFNLLNTITENKFVQPNIRDMANYFIAYLHISGKLNDLKYDDIDAKLYSIIQSETVPIHVLNKSIYLRALLRCEKSLKELNDELGDSFNKNIDLYLKLQPNAIEPLLDTDKLFLDIIKNQNCSQDTKTNAILGRAELCLYKGTTHLKDDEMISLLENLSRDEKEYIGYRFYADFLRASMHCQGRTAFITDQEAYQLLTGIVNSKCFIQSSLINQSIILSTELHCSQKINLHSEENFINRLMEMIKCSTRKSRIILSLAKMVYQSNDLYIRERYDKGVVILLNITTNYLYIPENERAEIELFKIKMNRAGRNPGLSDIQEKKILQFIMNHPKISTNLRSEAEKYIV